MVDFGSMQVAVKNHILPELNIGFVCLCGNAKPCLGNPYSSGKFNTIHILVLTSSDQLLFKLSFLQCMLY